MKRLSVLFTAPHRIDVAQDAMPDIQPDQVLVQSIVSAISAGTEMLFYRGQVPPNMDVDASLTSLPGKMRYPLKYGYALVGEVTATGAQIDPAWNGRRVFAFHPHESHFTARLDELIALPDDIEAEDAAFLPNMETAVNLVMDGRPMLGEHVVVIGQGVVGLLTTGLLAQFPLGQIVALDRYPLRLEMARAFGAHVALDPATQPEHALRSTLAQGRGADLIYELSGNPSALNLAIALAGYSGRIVVGSWYGQKQAPIDLGGRFHRQRIQIISSQVSTIAPEWSGRWDKVRRFAVAWDMIRRLRPRQLVTHRVAVTEAAQTYALLDQQPEQALQALLTYPGFPES
ncbi:MAG: zinc-dependent alcohol dehydrogenase [Anaerolineae bacterium]